MSISFTSTAWGGEGADPTNDRPARTRRSTSGSTASRRRPGRMSHRPTRSPARCRFRQAQSPATSSKWARSQSETGATVHDQESTWVDVTIPNLACGDEELASGRFTGGGHQVRVGEARVTRGLTIHCDLLLSNNLEVNWGGNKFHMTEHLTTVECSDDPAIVQAPPPAPLDTLSASAPVATTGDGTRSSSPRRLR